VEGAPLPHRRGRQLVIGGERPALEYWWRAEGLNFPGPTDPLWSRMLPTWQVRAGPIVGGPHVARGRSRKGELHARTGVIAVDMDCAS